MKTVKQSSRFKKDIKRYAHKPKMLKGVYDVVEMLSKGTQLPENMRPHPLHGEYEGCMECHIGGDYLLICIDEKTNTIRLLRLGTHHELFGN